MTNKILYVFYDLAVAPPTYDFFTFMQTADLHRRRHGYSHIHFIFVPGPKEGFRDDNLPPDVPTRHSKMRNIVLRGACLLASCCGSSYLATRAEAGYFRKACGDSVFPRGYTVERPLNDYMWAGILTAYVRGEVVSQFTAPHESISQAEAYADQVAGERRLITITLRESDYHPERNSQINEWDDFIKDLDKETYAVVVVRETAKAHDKPLFEGVPESPLAAIDVCFRTALYQQSFLTMHVLNGTAAAAIHAGVPLLMFNMVENRCHSSSAEFIRLNQGIGIGDQLPMFPVSQKYIWKKDSSDVLQKEFALMVDLLAAHDTGSWALHSPSGKVQIETTCALALKYTANKMSLSAMTEDRQAILSIIEKQGGRNSISWNLLGVWLAMNGHKEQAAEAFGKSISFDPQNANTQQNLAAIQRSLKCN